MAEFTPTDKRLLDILSDGQSHLKEDLAKALWDEIHGPTALWTALTRLRPKLLRHGLVISSEYGSGYRLTRLLASPYSGYK